MLKFCELDQISFLDEVVVGAWTMWLAQGITAEVWTKVFSTVAEALGACMKFCNSITGVVLLFDQVLGCALWIGSVETFSDR
jgi:hypothetical protein